MKVVSQFCFQRQIVVRLDPRFKEYRVTKIPDRYDTVKYVFRRSKCDKGVYDLGSTDHEIGGFI